MLERKVQPHMFDAVEFDLKLKPYQSFTLDNGVPVYAVNTGEQEVIMVEWVFYAGNWYEEKNIVAASTNYLLKNGTSNRNAYGINEHFDYYGSYLNRSCYNETATMTLHSLSRHLEFLLPVVAELLTDSVFPDNEIGIYKQIQKQKLEVNLKKSEFVANRIIDELLYSKQHPYGQYTTLEEYDAVDRQELLNFFDRYYRNGKCILFVAGKLPADIEQQLNKNFGSLPFNRQPLQDVGHTAVPTEERKHKILSDPNGVQAAIRIGRHFPNRHHPDFMKVQVLNNIFGGYFGSRLMSNIREDKGYTYGIHSYLQNHIHESAWMISTEAGRDVGEATVTEIYNEMDRLCREPVAEDELHLVRNYMIGSILGDLDGPFQIIGRWKNYILNNLTEAYFYNSIETIKKISAEELRELARKYLRQEDFYELTVI